MIQPIGFRMQCDSCGTKTPFDRVEGPDLVEAAARAGWVCDDEDDKDYCPTCWRKLRPRTRSYGPDPVGQVAEAIVTGDMVLGTGLNLTLQGDKGFLPVVGTVDMELPGIGYPVIHQKRHLGLIEGGIKK